METELALVKFVCDLSPWQHRSFERTNQTESSRGPCGLFIVQEVVLSSSSVGVLTRGWMQGEGWG